MCSIPRRHQIAKRRSASGNNQKNTIKSTQLIGNAASREEQLEKANAIRKQKQALVNSEQTDTQLSFIEQITAKLSHLFSQKNYN